MGNFNQYQYPINHWMDEFFRLSCEVMLIQPSGFYPSFVQVSMELDDFENAAKFHVIIHVLTSQLEYWYKWLIISFDKNQNFYVVILYPHISSLAPYWICFITPLSKLRCCSFEGRGYKWFFQRAFYRIATVYRRTKIYSRNA